MAKGSPNKRAAFIAAPNAATAARIIDRDGRTVRTYVRKLGWYESKGTGWSTRSASERATVYAHFVPDAPKTRAPKVAPASE